MQTRMTTTGLLLLFCIVCQSLPAQTTLSSTADRVTLFLQGAQVERSAEFDQSAGTQEYELKGLSPFLDPASLRVRLPEGALLLDIRHELDFFAEQNPEERRQAYLNQLKQLEDSLKWWQTRQQVTQEQIDFLRNNRNTAGQQQGINFENFRNLEQYYAQRMEALQMQLLQLKRAQQSIQQQQQKVQRQMQELGQMDERRSRLFLKIQSEQPVKGALQLSYWTAGASWFPTYEVRVQEVDQPLRLRLQGNVQQATTEDWKQVQVVFSNANPQKTGQVPQLPPLYLQQYQYIKAGVSSSGATVEGLVLDETTGEPLPFANILVKGTTLGTATDVEGRFSLVLPYAQAELEVSYVGYANKTIAGVQPGNSLNIAMSESAQMLEEVAVVGGRESAQNTFRLEARTAGVTTETRQEKKKDAILPATVLPATTQFQIELDLPFDLPSDGQEYTLQLKEDELPATYEYWCLPKVDPTAYLQAFLTDWEQYDLLEGEAKLYFDNTYVGKSALSPATAGDTLQLSLGPDKSIRVERKQVKEYSKKNFIGDKRVETLGFRIEVHNTKSKQVLIRLVDQVPVSREKGIEVKVEELSGGQLNEETGRVEWTLNLPGGDVSNLVNRYTVKYPKRYSLRLD